MSNEIPSAVRRKVNDRDEMRCVACGSIGSEIQHRMRRREGGHRLSNLIRVCSVDHRTIHANPAWALEFGLTVSAVFDQDPSLVPVLTYRGWTLFDDEGGFNVIAPRNVSSATVANYLLVRVPPEG